MKGSLHVALTEILGEPPVRISALAGGCVGEVYRIEMADGKAFAAKVDDSPAPILTREAAMLRYLGDHSHLPVPRVMHSSERMLLMAFLPGDSRFTGTAEVHAAELLAELHDIGAPAVGFATDTLIGGLHQPNAWADSWLDFFRDQRLLFMGQEARRAGRLPISVFARLEKLAGRLERWVEEPERPALIHGDVWTHNVLAVGDRITGFLDPAIYFAHPEIELAFIALFNTFRQPFFRHYADLRPIRPGFWEERRHLYNLYPLLVHVRLFGGSYVMAVSSILEDFGC